MEVNICNKNKVQIGEIHGNELLQVIVGEVVYQKKETLLKEQTLINVYAFVFKNQFCWQHNFQYRFKLGEEEKIGLCSECQKKKKEY